jgi:hypothetical protein
LKRAPAVGEVNLDREFFPRPAELASGEYDSTHPPSWLKRRR